MTSPTPANLDPATLLDQAADLIAQVGLANLDDGGLWYVRDCTDTSYHDGDPVDVAGALAVVCGYRDSTERAEDEFLAAAPPHPVVAALLAALDLGDVLELYAWTDDLGQGPADGATAAQQQAVAALRTSAAHAAARPGTEGGAAQ